jgi:hypothetical protein
MSLFRLDKGMRKSKLNEILNEIKWTKDLNKAEVWYLHRGAPDDTKILEGKDILNIGRSFIETPTASIPYHRIFKIVYEGKTVFER